MKWIYFIWWAFIIFQLVIINWNLSEIRKQKLSIEFKSEKIECRKIKGE